MTIGLLAPSGNMESFMAAVNAGADAVYLGLKDFSARAKAKNFSYKQLVDICSFAKEKNVKIFVTVNTLIKNSEVKNVVKNLEQISAACADGIIVQDLGIVNIVKKYFPDIRLHASTQLAIHNTYGAKQAEKMGFDRVVLARELSFEEIKSIKNNTNIELEVFCHGALCFCVSGLCLFSSFIGGYSGNRGHCTQPCRRLWTTDGKNGYFLSPKDFQLIDYVKKLQEIGVASLKIEGRLKSPDYVAKTVSAYRLLIDSDETNYEDNLKQAKEILALDYARQKTTFNFLNKNDKIFEPEKSKSTGLFLGTIENKSAEKFLLNTEHVLNIGDTLRIVDKKKDKNVVLKIENCNKINNGYEINYNDIYLENGFEVFKIADGKQQLEISNEQLAINDNGSGLSHCEQQSLTITENFSFDKIQLPNLFVRIDNLKWLKILKERNIVIKLNKNNIINTKSLNNLTNYYFELPAYIDEADLSLFQKNIDFLISKGCKYFFINNISGSKKY
ncbi:MAG: U32 family peptidase [Elusimicrobia bacterium]|nr:U32 family peptidase [Elusimicrobiota bacterium]